MLMIFIIGSHHFVDMSKKHKTKEGYILLLSMLIISIILAISFGVYAISLKEVILASYLKDSARAFGAADRAVECTLYWDKGAPQNGLPYTIFTTSTQYISPLVFPNPDPICESQQINTVANGWTSVNNTVDTGTTNFIITFPDNTCAEVSVFKESNSTTTIVSNGYNTCDVTNPRRTQRTIQVQGAF